MIAAFDVHYEKGRAAAAAVLFAAYPDDKPFVTYARLLPAEAGYVPGKFYRRELPCILALLEQIRQPIDEIIIDGYVQLGENKPGLGQHLFDALDEKIPVIGAAKSRFEGAASIEVLRGRSLRPLFITSAGVNSKRAAENIRIMHGAHRIPTLLKHVDRLARSLHK